MKNKVNKVPTKNFHQLAERCKGYDGSTIWNKCNRLSQVNDCVNIGHGFPDSNPPDFFLEKYQKNIANGYHQYTRTLGTIEMVNSVARNYKDTFKRNIDESKEVVIGAGVVSLISSTIMSHVNPGDEVVMLEPCFDCYTPQVQFAGGKLIGVPLLPPLKGQTSWRVDFEKLKKSIGPKTKLFCINSPNNPTGKVLTYEELEHIADIIGAYPQITVLSDEVYEHFIFDDIKSLPRFANIPGMWERTVSLFSGGKTFSATATRVGWAVGPANIIAGLHSILQFNIFCMYSPLINTFAECLDIAKLPYKGYDTYYAWLRDSYQQQRDHAAKSLNEIEEYKGKCNIPEGSFFMVVDISKIDIKKHNYAFEEETNENYTKDFMFVTQTAIEKKVVVAPISPLYTPENQSYGENFVRVALCKSKETLDKAFANLKKKSL